MGYLQAFITVVIGALAIATAAIGIDCMRKEPKYDTQALKDSNVGYLTVALAMGILVVLFGFYEGYNSYAAATKAALAAATAAKA